MKDLTKNRWKFVLIPALIVIAGIVLYIVHGGFNFDVEFMGGIRMQVNMHTDFDNKEVADLIQEKTVDTVSAKVRQCFWLLLHSSFERMISLRPSIKPLKIILFS